MPHTPLSSRTSRSYQDLAVLHTPNKSKPEEVEAFKKMLIRDTLDFHAFDWYHNPFTMGAFAQFAPGQFSTLYADSNDEVWIPPCAIVRLCQPR
jgi:hypothetical protein